MSGDQPFRSKGRKPRSKTQAMMARDAGYAARQMGQIKEANPFDYIVSSYRHNAWRAGWEAADEHAAEDRKLA